MLNPNEADEYSLFAQDELLARARTGIRGFVSYTKDDYLWNWHNRALCSVVNRWVRGDLRFLMVFMPPRVGKSEIVSRRLPAYLHGLHPDAEIMCATYASNVAKDMTSDVQKIMDSNEYRLVFPDTRIAPARKPVPGAKRNAEEHWVIGHRGKYRNQGVGGAFTSRGARYIIVDDPIKGRDQADSPAWRKRVWDWYSADLRSRLNSSEGQILITLTRWHEDDLAGRLLANAKANPEADQWEVFSFPAIKEDVNNLFDPRRVGESIWPEKFPLTEYAKLRAQNARDWYALYQQRPSPDEGEIIKAQWWKYYSETPEEKAKDCDRVIDSWDLTFKGTEHSDYVVGEVWGRKGADKFLLDMVRGQITFTDTIQKMLALRKRWPQIRATLVEEAANGAALLDVLRPKIPGLIAVRPQGTKVARANAIAPQAEAGNLWLPDPKRYAFVPEFVEEWKTFPNGKHDDQVDACTQAISRLTDSVRTDFAPLSIGNGSTSFTLGV